MNESSKNETFSCLAARTRRARGSVGLPDPHIRWMVGGCLLGSPGSIPSDPACFLVSSCKDTDHIVLGFTLKTSSYHIYTESHSWALWVKLPVYVFLVGTHDSSQIGSRGPMRSLVGVGFHVNGKELSRFRSTVGTRSEVCLQRSSGCSNSQHVSPNPTHRGSQRVGPNPIHGGSQHVGPDPTHRSS